MEDILAKLKLLDYETKFCKVNTIKPFARTMFSMKSSNKRFKDQILCYEFSWIFPSVDNIDFTWYPCVCSTQFAQFIKVTKWLFVEAGRENFTIDRFDDPTTRFGTKTQMFKMWVDNFLFVCTHFECTNTQPHSVNKVMLELKNMDFEMDYPVNQLLDGNGEAVCQVLDFLTDKALAETGFEWKKQYKPNYPQEEWVPFSAYLWSLFFLNVLHYQFCRGSRGRWRSWRWRDRWWNRHRFRRLSTLSDCTKAVSYLCSYHQAWMVIYN